MARRRFALTLLAPVSAAAVLLACGCQPDTGISACDGGGAPEGAITQGEPPAGVKVTPPLALRGVLSSDAAIDLLMVGGAAAKETVTGTNFANWNVELSAGDLDALRLDGGPTAKIDVLAHEVCRDEPTLIDSVEVTIGPSLSVPVEDLDLDAEIPAGECYLPADGRASATLSVSADPAFAGATVTLEASQGTLSAKSVVLGPDGTSATSGLIFTAEKAGTATVTALSLGAPAEPVHIPVASAPTVSAASASEGVPRNKPYSVFVSSTGNLSHCRAEPSDAQSTTVTIAEPDLGPLAGTKSVKSSTLDCTAPELLRIEILFGDDAPDGALVTIRCTDTFGQEGSAAVKVTKQGG